MERIDNEIPDELKRKQNETSEVSNRESNSLCSKLKRIKELGNSHLLKGNNSSAIAEYSKAISLFENECKQDEIIEEKAVYAIVLSNLAQAYLNNGDFQNAILQAKKTLSVDSANLKAYFRAGKAYKFVYEKFENV